MNWFLIYFIVLGVFLGLIPRAIANNIGKAIENDYWYREKNINKVSAYLLFYYILIVMVCSGFTLEMSILQERKQEKLEKRISVIEEKLGIEPAESAPDTVNMAAVKEFLKGDDTVWNTSK